MTPLQVTDGFRIYVGDVREALKQIPDESVNMCVTSPPYWGLRDYSTAAWEGGDPGCDHVKGEMRRGLGLADSPASTRGGAKKAADTPDISYGNSCKKCSAQRVDKQLGLEATPEEYVANMVEVFREVRRVLRDDGTLWLNIGDSYATSGTRGYNGGKELTHMGKAQDTGYRGRAQGLKEKDLVGIPWMFAFALRTDGWYLRSDIIWSKPNPMPESIRDRPTKAHEYLFLLSKSPRYYYDNEAIREPAAWERWGDQTNGKHRDSGSAASWIKDKTKEELTPARRKPLIPEQTKQGVGTQGIGSETFGHWAGDRGRNKRSVWHIATQPYSKAHFATFPEKLVEPCILAGCPEWVCATCGEPRKRIVQSGHGDAFEGEARHTGRLDGAERRNPRGGQKEWDSYTPPETTGWTDCGHDNYVPGTVLDPFLGSGTTAQVARSLGRHCVGIELNADYVDLAIEHYHTRTKVEKLTLPPSAPEPIPGQLTFDT